MSSLVNQIRFFHYIAGVLSAQQADPLCRICKAYANTLSALKDDLRSLPQISSREFDALPPELLGMFDKARTIVTALHAPENALGQKKAGNCKMPEGVCFVKSSKAVRDRI